MKNFVPEILKLRWGRPRKKDEIEVYKRILQIDGLVDQVVSSDDVSGSKPDPDIVTAARSILGNLAAAECCFIGDSPFDATAAIQDGTKDDWTCCAAVSPEADLRVGRCQRTLPGSFGSPSALGCNKPVLSRRFRHRSTPVRECYRSCEDSSRSPKSLAWDSVPGTDM